MGGEALARERRMRCQPRELGHRREKQCFSCKLSWGNITYVYSDLSSMASTHASGLFHCLINIIVLSFVVLKIEIAENAC
jgi:hypothetical protein